MSLDLRIRQWEARRGSLPDHYKRAIFNAVEGRFRSRGIVGLDAKEINNTFRQSAIFTKRIIGRYKSTGLPAYMASVQKSQQVPIGRYQCLC